MLDIPNLESIAGLRVESRWRADNGGDSHVVPFASIHPANIAFHGESHFEYGHYGIHLGQEDRLTFLGDPEKEIRCYFIDCRAGSATLHRRLTCLMNPSSARTLCIPPGVAHAFDGLDHVFTVNSYRLFLPDPTKWLEKQIDWDIGSDVHNLPMDVSDDELPEFEPNEHEASDVFYSLIAQHQKNALPNLKHDYPFTDTVTLANGESVKLKLSKERKASDSIPTWEPIPTIDGLGWQRHFSISSGDESGFIALLDNSPFYVVDHGSNKYEHDAFGIHLGQQDRLTFLGSSNAEILLRLVDMRKNSPTLHAETTIRFSPSPLRFLVIPNGVAHAFSGLENVFTVNRPLLFADDASLYQPGNDVIDWPIENENYPCFEVSTSPVSDEFYSLQATSQQKMIEGGGNSSTPMVFVTKDENGNDVRVALRKQ